MSLLLLIFLFFSPVIKNCEVEPPFSIDPLHQGFLEVVKYQLLQQARGDTEEQQNDDVLFQSYDSARTFLTLNRYFYRVFCPFIKGGSFFILYRARKYAELEVSPHTIELFNGVLFHAFLKFAIPPS